MSFVTHRLYNRENDYWSPGNSEHDKKRLREEGRNKGIYKEMKKKKEKKSDWIKPDILTTNRKTTRVVKEGDFACRIIVCSNQVTTILITLFTIYTQTWYHKSESKHFEMNKNEYQAWKHEQLWWVDIEKAHHTLFKNIERGETSKVSAASKIPCR